mgnify:CR=1 FL=1
MGTLCLKNAANAGVLNFIMPFRGHMSRKKGLMIIRMKFRN